MRSRFRFSIRFVLFAVLVVACVLALWRARPTHAVLVMLDAGGRIRLDGRELDRADLPAALIHQSARRRWWWIEPHVQIRVDPEVVSGDVIEIVELARQAGFEKVSLGEREEAQAASIAH